MKDKVIINENLYLSMYMFIVGKLMLIINVIIFDGIGNKIDKGVVLFFDGKIVGLSIMLFGELLFVFDNVVVIDGEGKWVMFGIIDNYSYLGVYFFFLIKFYFDGNEMISFVIV